MNDTQNAERMTPRMHRALHKNAHQQDLNIKHCTLAAQDVYAEGCRLEKELSEALEEVGRLKGDLKTEQGLSEARTKALNKLWKEKLDAAEKMRGEALLELGTMQNERDAYASHIAKEG